MLVKLQRNWFGPDGAQYRKGIVELDGGLEKQLPSDAVVLEEDKPKAAPAKKDDEKKAEESKSEKKL